MATQPEEPWTELFDNPKITQIVNKFFDENENKPFFPNQEEVFSAFSHCTEKNIKIVILGQDPYPTRGHANGLAFSVSRNIKPLPGSLQNIYKELRNEGFVPPPTGCLKGWAEQGILLLNTTLTIGLVPGHDKGKPRSHFEYWEKFTELVIEYIDNLDRPVLFVLWGNDAKYYTRYIKKQTYITSVHPSPLSASNGFFGNGHFKKMNEFVKKNYKTEIEWSRDI